MNKNIFISLIIGLIIGAISMFFIKSKNIEYVDVPFEVEVLVPSIENSSDTIIYPQPIIPKYNNKPKIDSTYYKKWLELKNDSIRRDSLFQKSIEINTYNETFEDDTLSISLYMKTRGEVQEYQLGYKTKDRIIKLDTTLTIPIPKKAEFYGGINTYIPYGDSQLQPSIVPTIDYVNKKHRIIYSLGIDVVNKGVITGIKYRF